MTKMPCKRGVKFEFPKKIRGCPFLGNCGSSRWEGGREKSGKGVSESERARRNFD